MDENIITEKTNPTINEPIMLLEEAKALVHSEYGSLMVVGRLNTPEEEDRMGVLAKAEKLIDEAIETLKSKKISPKLEID